MCFQIKFRKIRYIEQLIISIPRRNDSGVNDYLDFSSQKNTSSKYELIKKDVVNHTKRAY